MQSLLASGFKDLWGSRENRWRQKTTTKEVKSNWHKLLLNQDGQKQSLGFEFSIFVRESFFNWSPLACPPPFLPPALVMLRVAFALQKLWPKRQRKRWAFNRELQRFQEAVWCFCMQEMPTEHWWAREEPPLWHTYTLRTLPSAIAGLSMDLCGASTALWNGANSSPCFSLRERGETWRKTDFCSKNSISFFFPLFFFPVSSPVVSQGQFSSDFKLANCPELTLSTSNVAPLPRYDLLPCEPAS